jgi:hypothetical protein
MGSRNFLTVKVICDDESTVTQIREEVFKILDSGHRAAK